MANDSIIHNPDQIDYNHFHHAVCSVMVTGNHGVGMADDQYRAVLTEREEEILSGKADVSDNYRYRTISRVRSKIERLDHDVNVLGEYKPELLDELRDVVCEERDE